MARIKYSALVESIQGSIQGTTFQRNAYGHTVKGKPNMVKPYTQGQVLQKQIMTQCAQAWRSLSELQRATWNAYAENNPRPSRLNPDAYLTGYNYFLFVNRFRLIATMGILAEPVMDQYELGVYDFQLYTENPDLFLEINPSVESGAWTALFYLTPQIPMGREFVHYTPRFITDTAWSTGTVLSIGEKYEETIGKVPPVDSWVGYKIVFIEATNGQVVISPLSQAQVLINP